MNRRNAWLFGCIVVGATAFGVSRTAGAADDAEQNDYERAVAQAIATSKSPPTTLPSRVPPGAASAAAKYEQEVATAVMAANLEADRLRASGQRLDKPVPLKLPAATATATGRPPTLAEIPLIPRELPAVPGKSGPATPESTSDSTDPGTTLPATPRFQASSPYQSDRVFMATVGGYAMDLFMWIPGGDSTSDCDGLSASCFWFNALGTYMSGGNGYMHIGPEHGSSFCGQSGAGWRLNVSGYNGGVHTPCNLNASPAWPTDRWVRVRVWEIGSTASTKTYGAWVQDIPYSNAYAGSVTLNGTSLGVTNHLFQEVYETNGPCNTNRSWTAYEGMYIWDWYSGGTVDLNVGTRSFDAGCNNTDLPGYAGAYGFDWRNTARISGGSGTLFSF